MLCRIQQEFGITEFLLSAETPSDQPPVPAEGKHKGGNRPNSEGNNFVLLHFLFLEALSCLCTLPGIGDLLLRAGFLQPGSLHSHFHPVLLCCDSSVGQSNAPLHAGIQLFPLKGNQPCFPQHQHATRSLPLAEPFSLSQLCPGLGQAARPRTPAAGIGVGWRGANYPVLTRQRLRLCTLKRSRLPRWVISLETRWVLTQGNELVPGESSCAWLSPACSSRAPETREPNLKPC